MQLRGVLPPQPLTVSADRRALKQIVLNLVFQRPEVHAQRRLGDGGPVAAAATTWS